uniref:Anaphase-promoting complex subunit 11 n=1 Tax=Leptocylindrus danicus TaxID=163516 RepID=A0A7S2KPK2_9STRA|mmetsp:Transcript_24941/g.37305  ORF Transcript_24941/g.37305 Transcript_24941/m.37305 type:complete len:669 (+) Transcript_24941:208-2214(+)
MQPHKPYCRIEARRQKRCLKLKSWHYGNPFKYMESSVSNQQASLFFNFGNKISRKHIPNKRKRRSLYLTVIVMRDHPFINRRPQEFDETITLLSQNTFFLVNRPGPTVFIISSPPDITFKVTIGNIQNCSCGEGLKAKKLCVHILFVMLRVLRIEDTNPLAWQLSLTDDEVTRILDGKHRFQRRDDTKRKFHRKGKKSANQKDKRDEDQDDVAKVWDDPGFTRERKRLTEDELCPICQEEMTTDQLKISELCFCISGCLANFHVKCMKMVESYASAKGKSTQCPLCRAEFGPLVIPNASSAPKSVQGKAYIKCSSCNCKISGHSHFFRCVNCPTHDNCKRCFKRASSSTVNPTKHIFVTSKVEPYPFHWSVATPPTKNMGTSDLVDLQSREFSDRDYQLLLSLDHSPVPLMHHHLALALPSEEIHSFSTDTQCSVCSCPLSAQKSIKRFPCNHVGHESCTINLLMDLQNDNIAEASCRKCSAPLFPSLQRKPSIKSSIMKKTAGASRTQCDASMSNQAAPMQNKLICGIVGIGAKKNFPLDEAMKTIRPSQNIGCATRPSERSTGRLHGRKMATFELGTRRLQILGANASENLRNEVDALTAKRNHSKGSHHTQYRRSIDRPKRAVCYTESVSKSSHVRESKSKVGFDIQQLKVSGSRDALHTMHNSE